MSKTVFIRKIAYAFCTQGLKAIVEMGIATHKRKSLEHGSPKRAFAYCVTTTM